MVSEITESSQDDELNVEIPVSDDASSISTGKVTKRYVNVIEYTSTFYDENGNPLENTIVYCGVDNLCMV